MSTPAAPAERLPQLLKQQLLFLTEFLELTKAQTLLIETEDISAFNENLENRAQLITTVDGMRPELEGLLQDYSNKIFSANSQAIEDLRQQISRILATITEIDKKNQAAARERMDFFQAEFRRTSDTRKGVGTYMKGAEVFGASFVDERQ